MARFGECLKEIRLEAGFGLRSFSQAISMDAGNLSRLERGKHRPPKGGVFYEDVAHVLNLNAKDQRIQRLRDLAMEERLSEVSTEVSSYAREVELVPLLLRTISDKKLSKDQIHELVEEIKANY